LDKSICIIAGSKSDDKIVNGAVKVLEELNVPHSNHICSAHRDPVRLQSIVREAENSGCRVFICIAGMAAHLPGVVASLTTRPVVGVPASGSKLEGWDALLSIVQMPQGVPVACVAVDGGSNGALLACQVLATDPAWSELKRDIDKLREKARDL